MKRGVREIVVLALLAVMLARAVTYATAGYFTIAILLICAAHAIFCVSGAIPNHAWTGPLVRRFRTAAREIWLTIDDGPHPDSTPAILEVLRSHGARATFFVIGRRAERHPELLRAIVNSGYTLGNHSHSHPSASFWTAGPWRVGREIDGASAAIRAAGLPAPEFFRPPVGMANLFVAPALRARRMLRIGWSARGFDTRPQDVSAMVDRIAGQCAPGAIILFHEMGAAAGARSLDALLERLTRDGYKCVIPSREALTCARSALDSSPE
jgi:peptidoglycan/xylan/chitin deacetylase (PgdA/CDA1 family)